MDNGDFALFAWDDTEAYWLGNTETPSALWQTKKYGWDEVPTPIALWAQRILLRDLYTESDWLREYPNLAWYFLPILLSKDGRHSSREYFWKHSAGFPEASTEDALSFYERFLGTGVMDPYRYTMASKLGTSRELDIGRMNAAMAEFNTAKLLFDSGYNPVPEAEVVTGHSIDFSVDDVLVEVTRPQPPRERSANTASKAVKETVGSKANGQLKEYGGDVVLFVDTSSFGMDEWDIIRDMTPDLPHHPTVVYHCHPEQGTQGYRVGQIPVSLDIDWVG